MDEKDMIPNYDNFIKDYRIILKKVQFNETLQYLNSVNNSLKTRKLKSLQEIQSDFLIHLKTDFLSTIDGDVDSYSIANEMFNEWGRGQMKQKNAKKIHNVGRELLRIKLIENNLGNIVELYEQEEVIKLGIRDVRFYLLLLGIVVIGDASKDLGDRYIEIFHTYNPISESKRKDILRKYLTLKTSFKNKIDNDIPEIEFLRNQIAHGWFETNGSTIKIYKDRDLSDSIKFSYEDIHKIYNSITSKLTFLEALVSMSNFIYLLSKEKMK